MIRAAISHKISLFNPIFQQTGTGRHAVLSCSEVPVKKKKKKGEKKVTNTKS